jgi:hypothetical protein
MMGFEILSTAQFLDEDSSVKIIELHLHGAVQKAEKTN